MLKKYLICFLVSMVPIVELMKISLLQYSTIPGKENNIILKLTYKFF